MEWGVEDSYRPSTPASFSVDVRSTQWAFLRFFLFVEENHRTLDEANQRLRVIQIVVELEDRDEPIRSRLSNSVGGIGYLLVGEGPFRPIPDPFGLVVNDQRTGRRQTHFTSRPHRLETQIHFPFSILEMSKDPLRCPACRDSPFLVQRDHFCRIDWILFPNDARIELASMIAKFAFEINWKTHGNISLVQTIVRNRFAAGEGFNLHTGGPDQPAAV
jgi:hypothetical protein